MAVYIDEEDVWKCPQHPSRRRRTGICHVCLRDKLSSLCPDCGNVRPCACYASTSSSSGSSSSSSSFSRFSSFAAAAGVGSVGRVSSLIDNEPAFRRSRSVAVPFFRSKPAAADDDDHHHDASKHSSKTNSFWTLFKGSGRSKSSRYDVERHASVLDEEEDRVSQNEEERKRMMRKSRSVVVTSSETHGPAFVNRSSSKARAWYFPSPIKAFRQSISKGIMVQQRSPLYRG